MKPCEDKIATDSLTANKDFFEINSVLPAHKK
jgi:hypothetical protein